VRPLEGFGHVARQSGFAGGTQLAGAAVRLGVAVVVARLLGPSGLGQYILALSLVNGATAVACVGLDRAALRFVAHHQGRAERSEAVGMFLFASAVSATVATIIAVVLFHGASELAAWLHRPELAAAARIVAVCVPFSALGRVARAGLCGFEDVRLPLVLEQLGLPATTLAVLLGVHLVHPTSDAGVVAAAVAHSVVGVTSWLALLVRFRREPAIPRMRVRSWLSFSMPMWVEGGMLYVVGATAYAFLARYGETDAVAIYGSALRIAGLAGLPLLAVSSIFGPTISNLAAKDDLLRLQAMYSRLTWALVLVGAGLSAGLIVGGRWALALFGPRFSAGYGVLLVLAVGQFVNSGTGPSGLVLTMSGRAGWRLATATLGAVLTVALSALLVPRWGEIGAAGAVVIASTTCNVAQVFEVRWLLGLWAYGRPNG